MKYNHYGPGYGPLLDSHLLREYQDKIDANFEICDFDMSDQERRDIHNTLQQSLRNGRTFYSNAPEYIRHRMREYEARLREGVIF